MSAGNSKFDMSGQGSEGCSGDVSAWIVASRVNVIVYAQEGDGLTERPRGNH
jgi:hypothetical protein